MYRLISGTRQPIDYVAPDTSEAANDAKGRSLNMWALYSVVAICISAFVGGSALCWLARGLFALGGN